MSTIEGHNRNAPATLVRREGIGTGGSISHARPTLLTLGEAARLLREA